ncbi:MAG: ATP-dependent Clp protease ATP-binding subunit [Patescibacteria group bacterium]|nr:ATP-dependent Clp protease ATP-binding subunit [Patescibacteria group bacterium]
MISFENKRIFFKDSRLEMTILDRMLIRIISFVFNFIFIILTFVFLLSDIKQLRFIGILFLLFLIDRLIHLKDPDYLIDEVLNKNEINLSQILSPQSFQLIEKAYDQSLILNKNFYFLIILKLLEQKDIINSLKRLNIDFLSFKNKLEDFKNNSENIYFSKQQLNSEIENLLKAALIYSLNHNEHFIDNSALFVGLFNINNESLNKLLQIFNLDSKKIEQAVLFQTVANKFKIKFNIPKILGAMVSGGRKKIRHRIINRSWTSTPTPILDKFSIDLTDLARSGQIGFMIGHNKEYQRLIEILSRNQNPNVLLVGDVGVGKGTIINHLAYNLVYDKVPQSLFDKRLVQLQISMLIAGASETDIQKRLQLIIDEILLSQNIILVIPEIHNLVKTSGQFYISVADALLPIIQNDLFPVIGTTYPREFKHIIETRSDFLNSFETIFVSEITEEEAEKILIYESLILENENNVFITFDAVRNAVKLAKKYFNNKPLPSSAEEILKTAVIETKLREEKIVGRDEIIKVVEEKSQIPVHEVESEERQKLLNLEDLIHQKLINQNDAVEAVADYLRQYRAGLSRKKGPIASFLFVGPTGVGKTELAKVLAEIQFGSEKNMIRFDMSEYQTKESIYRFIGNPNGDLNGELTEAVLHKPYSLILLDEFEKAHSDILNLFLQVLDDGRLTDNFGRIIDFSNTIIIATSNAGAEIILEALRAGKSAEDVSLYLKQKLTDYFKPELLNRFSKIIVFKELSLDDLVKIVKINCEDLIKDFKEKGINLEFSDEALKFLAKAGYDPLFGARPLRRVIEEKIKSPLAKEILAKNIESGNKIVIDFVDQKIIFNIFK